MKLPEFVDTRKARWDELEGLIALARTRAERLGPEGVLRLAALYRAAAADLALARRAYPGDPVVGRLERLVTRSRALVYVGGGRRTGVVEFFADTYWRLIWERRRPLLLALLLLVAPAVFGFVWAMTDPERVAAGMPVGFLWVREATTTDQGYGTAGLIGFSTAVLTNNVRVTLLAFALGVVWGIGTGYVLASNGLVLGAVAGLAVEAGNGRLLAAAVMAHGILELSCVVVGGAAGLSLGRALLRPGWLTRRASLAAEAPAAVQIAAGTALWLVLAGFVEGFAGRTGLSWLPTTAIGLALGGLYWGVALRRGRTPPAEAVEPA